MMTRRRLLLALTAAMWLAVLGGSATAVEGYKLRAVASGATVAFDQPGSPIPAKPTGEFHQAYSDASHETGPIGHGLSSMLWPGSTAANAGSFFGFPNYPVRAEAFHPAGPPEEKKNEGGNFTMIAHSNETETGAETSSQRIPGGPAVEIGSLTSSATSSVDGDQAVSTATAGASNIVVGGGAMTIESVVTKATASSDGTQGKVDGKTVVKGVTTAGGSVVSVEGSGISLGGQTIPVNPAPVEAGLQQLGITMRVARPVDKLEGADASRRMGGLVLEFAPGAAGVPAGTSLTYHIAAVNVSAQATQAPADLTVALPPIDEAPAAAPAAPAGGSVPASVGDVVPLPLGDPTFESPAAESLELAAEPASAPLPLPVAVMPVGLAVFAGLGSVVGGRLLSGLAKGALTRGVGTVCPLAER